jgi:hypothetical protein
LDKIQRAKIVAELKRLKGHEPEDYITFGGVCVNLFIANKSGKRHSMDAWLKANKLEVLKEVSNQDLIIVAYEALDKYLKIDPGGIDTFDEHFQ